MKLREFQEELQRLKLDAAVFLTNEQKHDLSIDYFTQTRIDYGAFVVPARKEPFLLIPGFEYARIKESAPVRVVEAKKRLSDELKAWLGNAKRIGINEDLLSVSEEQRLKKALKTKLIPVASAIGKLRLTKTPAELKLLKQAANIGCEIINECVDRFSRFKTEQEVDRFLRTRTIEAGCGLSFPPIVASGPAAAFPHHVPGGKLKRGLVVLDFGVRYKGYCSDMTRTIAYGKPTAQEREAYENLLAVQEWAIAQMKPGTNAQKLETRVTRKLGSYGKYFIHRLGHSVGLQVHDVMTPEMSAKPVMKQGIVWTVEPGIYVPGKFGMRIEDTVMLTEDGCTVLTKNTPKRLNGS
jgi:Xaa-Pro aminopeptidase